MLIGIGFKDRVLLNFTSFYGAFLFVYGMGFFLQLLDNFFDTFELVQVNLSIVSSQAYQLLHFCDNHCHCVSDGSKHTTEDDCGTQRVD